MLQSPYFFFDVVYLHNGVEEQGDEASWRVREPAEGSLRSFDGCFSLFMSIITLSLLQKPVFIGSHTFKKICPSMDYKNTVYFTYIVLLAS